MVGMPRNYLLLVGSLHAICATSFADLLNANTRLPKPIINKLEQQCRRFIQSGNSEVKKIHTVNWADLCQPKLSGGLCLKNLKLMNGALLMRIGWGLLVNPNSYWARILGSKYSFDPTADAAYMSTKYGSYLWKDHWSDLA